MFIQCLQSGDDILQSCSRHAIFFGELGFLFNEGILSITQAVVLVFEPSAHTDQVVDAELQLLHIFSDLFVAAHVKINYMRLGKSGQRF